MERQVFISNFNFCPLMQSPTLGSACLECEHMNKVEEEYFCICEEEENPDQLSVREIINVLLDLLTEGYTTIDRNEISGIITDM